MATATAQALQPETRKGRTATVRPSTKYINSNANTDSAITLRLQRLRPFGIVGCRADLIASLAWGGMNV